MTIMGFEKISKSYKEWAFILLNNEKEYTLTQLFQSLKTHLNRIQNILLPYSPIFFLRM